jgi:hypothetical protein
VDQLNTAQQRRLKELIHNKNNPERITEQEVFTKGQVDSEMKCFNLELARHLGGNKKHNQYAEFVTGAKGDYLIITRTPQASYAFYDGEVKDSGEAVNYNEPPGRMAEVKTGGKCWTKVLNDQLDQLSDNEWNEIIQTLRELNYQINVAIACKRQSFISFSTQEYAEAAQEVFAKKAELPGVVHLIEPT